jgi:hypothetical protein
VPSALLAVGLADVTVPPVMVIVPEDSLRTAMFPFERIKPPFMLSAPVFALRIAMPAVVAVSVSPTIIRVFSPLMVMVPVPLLRITLLVAPPPRLTIVPPLMFRKPLPTNQIVAWLASVFAEFTVPPVMVIAPVDALYIAEPACYCIVPPLMLREPMCWFQIATLLKPSTPVLPPNTVPPSMLIVAVPSLRIVRALVLFCVPRIIPAINVKLPVLVLVNHIVPCAAVTELDLTIAFAPLTVSLDEPVTRIAVPFMFASIAPPIMVMSPLPLSSNVFPCIFMPKPSLNALTTDRDDVIETLSPTTIAPCNAVAAALFDTPTQLDKLPSNVI